MVVEEIKGGVVIRDIENFHPTHTFECGQCFRWKKEGNSYIGVAKDRVLEVQLREGDLYLYNTSLEEFYGIWMDYFDFKRDYRDIHRKLEKDPILQRAIAYGQGIRILNQDEWETLISFIISANKNIPHIKVIIEGLCKTYGKPVEYKGNIYYTFPTPQELLKASIEEIGETKCGYRAKYIYHAIRKVLKGEVDLYALKKCTTEEARKELLRFYGVGPKIADCVLLFSMGKHDAFPTDVWIKKAMEYFYFKESTPLGKIQDSAKEKWGQLAGFAQQYLFYYAREDIGK